MPFCLWFFWKALFVFAEYPVENTVLIKNGINNILSFLDKIVLLGNEDKNPKMPLLQCLIYHEILQARSLS